MRIALDGRRLPERFAAGVAESCERTGIGDCVKFAFVRRNARRKICDRVETSAVRSRSIRRPVSARNPIIYLRPTAVRAGMGSHPPVGELRIGNAIAGNAGTDCSVVVQNKVGALQTPYCTCLIARPHLRRDLAASALLGEFPQEAWKMADASLVQAMVAFHTNDEDKDEGAHVTVMVRQTDGIIAAWIMARLV